MATNPPIYPPPPRSGSNLPLALAGGAIVAMLAGNIYLFMQIQDLKKDSVRSRDEIQSEIDKVVEASSAMSASSRRNAEHLREELDAARRQALDAAQSAAQRAKQEAISNSNENAKKLEAQQEQLQTKLSSDIG